MSLGYSPKNAAFLAIQTEDERKYAKDFEEYELDPETLNAIVKTDEKTRIESKKYIDMGINPNFVLNLTSLSDEEKENIPYLVKLKIDDEILYDFAVFDKNELDEALSYLNKGVSSIYIKEIADIENGNSINELYDEFREKGYSYTSSYVLSNFDENENQMLEQITAQEFLKQNMINMVK